MHLIFLVRKCLPNFTYTCIDLLSINNPDITRHRTALVYLLCLIQLWNGLMKTFTGSKYSLSLFKRVFFGHIRTHQYPPLSSDWLKQFRFFICNRFADFDETWHDENQVFNFFYLVCVLRFIIRNRWAPWPLICWQISEVSAAVADSSFCQSVSRNDRFDIQFADAFYFSSEIAEQIWTKLYRKHVLNVP